MVSWSWKCSSQAYQGASFSIAIRQGISVGCYSLQGSGVERSGAAQGLAEVLAVLGPRQVEALLPDIMANTKNKSPFVREGHLNLFKFLPLVMPEQFQVRGRFADLDAWQCSMLSCLPQACRSALFFRYSLSAARQPFCIASGSPPAASGEECWGTGTSALL